MKNLKLQLFDYNTILKNQLVGGSSLDVEAIKKEKYKKMGWIHLYGPSNEADSDISKLMNEFPNKGIAILLATFYRGSILMSVEVIPNSKETATGVFPFKGQENRDVRMANYQVILDVRSIFNFTSSQSDYKLKVTCGSFSTWSRSKVGSS